jgi:hypothetical protein
MKKRKQKKTLIITEPKMAAARREAVKYTESEVLSLLNISGL